MVEEIPPTSTEKAVEHTTQEVKSVDEINWPVELADGVAYRYKANSTQTARFFINVEDPMIVKVTASIANLSHAPEVYIGIDNENVCKDDCTFTGQNKSDKRKVTVFPQDAKFMCGAWCIAVEAPKAPANKEFTYEIKVTLLEARPIKLLRPNQKETVSISDYSFFKYAVQEKEDFHNHLLKLNISKK